MTYIFTKVKVEFFAASDIIRIVNGRKKICKKCIMMYYLSDDSVGLQL